MESKNLRDTVIEAVSVKYGTNATQSNELIKRAFEFESPRDKYAAKILAGICASGSEMSDTEAVNYSVNLANQLCARLRTVKENV